MDWLTFVSNLWNAAGNFAWPAVFLTGLVLFREPLKKAILSLKVIRYKDLEVELVAPEDCGFRSIVNARIIPS